MLEVMLTLYYLLSRKDVPGIRSGMLNKQSEMLIPIFLLRVVMMMTQLLLFTHNI